MSNVISYIFEVRDRMTRELQKISNTMDSVTSQIRKSQTQISKSFENITESANKMKDVGKTLSTRVTLPFGIFGGLALRSASKMETLETAFVGILGSAEKASLVVKDLFEFTAKTPFELPGVATSARQLLAANVETENLKDRLQLLGDISSAANIPLQDMSSIFAKIKNKGKAMTEEILQMSDRGIPIIQVLSDQFNITKDQVFSMAEKSQISFEMITKAMQSMTSKGGFAFNAMINQSKTFSGIMSTLKDNISLTMGDIGNVFLEDAKSIAKSIIKMTESVRDFVKEHPTITKVALAIAGITAVVGPALIIIGQMALGVTALVKVYAAAKIAIIAFNGALITSPITATMVAITAAVAIVVTFRKEIWEATKFVGEFIYKWTGLKTVFENVIKPIFIWIGEKIEWLSNKLTSFLSKFDGITSIASKVGDFFTGGLPESERIQLPQSRIKRPQQEDLITQIVRGNVQQSQSIKVDLNQNLTLANAPKGTSMQSNTKSNASKYVQMGINSTMAYI